MAGQTLHRRNLWETSAALPSILAKRSPVICLLRCPVIRGPSSMQAKPQRGTAHNYIDAAQAKGAIAAMTHDGVARAFPQLPVRDTLSGLRSLATHRRNHSGAVRIAITGSSGKTTAKTLLAAGPER